MARRRGSARGYDRSERLNELLRQIVATELDRIDDERLELVTITAVETDRDLTTARVFFSSFDEDTDLVAAILDEHRRRLQDAIGRRAKLRGTPPLHFVSDATTREADRIEGILRSIAAEKVEDEVADSDGADG